MMRSIHYVALASAIISTSCNGESGADGTTVPPIEAPPAPAPAKARALHAVPIEGLPLIGAPDALVTVVEFSDYDCPYCGKAEHTMDVLRQKYGRELRVAVAEHPLPIHPHARDAALAALAAADSPNLPTFRAKLFANPDARSAVDLARLAGEADVGRFAEGRARTAGSAEESLARAEALAEKLHVRGTPTFFVNGRKIGGAQPLATFESVIIEELARARALVRSGVPRDRVYDAILHEARANPAPLDDDAAEEGLAFVAEAKTAGGAHLAGRADARETIVVFTDFECPYCKRLDGELRQLAESRRDLRIVLRNKPLPMHANARLAAKAAIAADAQGKLGPFAQVVFEHQQSLDRASLESYASIAGLDVRRFSRDLDAASTDARLAEDEALAARLGVRGTPTSFVEGHRVVGAQPIARFATALVR